MANHDEAVADKKSIQQDPEAEKKLLGALLFDNAPLVDVCTLIAPEDFADTRHQHIFRSITKLFEDNQRADLITVADRLTTDGFLAQAGGRTYLVSLTEDVYTAAGCSVYAEIVRKKSVRRQLLNAAGDILQVASKPEGPIEEILDSAEKKIFDIASQRSHQSIESIHTLLPATFKKLEEMPQMQGQITGLATGFKELDTMMSGLHEGELIIAAGRPGMGKTAFCLRIMENVAVEHNQACAIFSLEMSNEQVVQRLLCSRAKVSGHRMRTGNLRDAEWTNLNYAVGPLSDSPIFMDDSSTLSIWELRSKARHLHYREKVKLIVVDYLQLMSAGVRSENRQQEISLISRSLKALAKELEIPIIACSQLSRQVETRGENKRPQLADLRESGAIEQDADVVMFVYRPAAYKFSAEEREEMRGTEEENLAEIIVAKQRNGPTGIAKLTFMEECIRFENREHRHAEVGPPPGDVPF